MVLVKDSLAIRFVDKILSSNQRSGKFRKIYRQNSASIISEICARFLRVRGVRCDNATQPMSYRGCLAPSPEGIYLPVSHPKYQTRPCNHAFIAINIRHVIKYHAILRMTMTFFFNATFVFTQHPSCTSMRRPWAGERDFSLG